MKIYVSSAEVARKAIYSATKSIDFDNLDGLLEIVLYDTWDNYRYDNYSVSDIADVVMEHVDLIIGEMDEDGVHEEYLNYINPDNHNSAFYRHIKKYVKEYYYDYEWEEN